MRIEHPAVSRADQGHQPLRRIGQSGPLEPGLQTVASAGSPLGRPVQEEPPQSLGGFALKFNVCKGFGVVVQEFRVGQEGAQDHRLARRFGRRRP